MFEIKDRPIEEMVEDEQHSPRLDPWHPCGLRIHGCIYDDPRFPDGTWVRTSVVISQGAGWAQTKNTFYVLGEKNANQCTLIEGHYGRPYD